MNTSSHFVCWRLEAFTPLPCTVDFICGVDCVTVNHTHHHILFTDSASDLTSVPFVTQATDRPMGMNGLDVAGLRPFDLVIPFTIQKGEITGNKNRLDLSSICGDDVCVVCVPHCVSLSSAEGEVRMPSGKVAKPDITDNKDGTVTVKYAPTEAGLHEMDIKYDGIHIPGTAYLLNVGRNKHICKLCWRK